MRTALLYIQIYIVAVKTDVKCRQLVHYVIYLLFEQDIATFH